MELFKKNKSTINKIGNGQTQSGRIPMTQGTSPLLQGRAFGNSTPTLPGTNVPFRNEEQYQRSLGNMTRIPVSPQATQAPTSSVSSLGGMMTGNSSLTRGNSSLLQGNALGSNPVTATTVAQANMSTSTGSVLAPAPSRIPVSATENPRLASAGITTDAVYAPTSGDRGIPLSAVATIPSAEPTPQIPVGLMGDSVFAQSQRIPAQAPTFDSTLSLQEQINQIENEYNRKAQNLYAEGGLRGMTAGAASSLENVFRQRELSELTPLQQRLELLQARQEAEATQAQQEFDNQIALREAGMSGDIDFSQPLQLSQAQQALFQASGIDPNTVATDPIARAMMSTAGGRELTQGELENHRELFGVIERVGTITDQLTGDKKGNLSSIKPKDTGPILGVFRNINPFDVDAQQFNAAITGAVPGLARGVFGEVGVLTDTDMKRYASVLPNLRNTEEVNQALALLTLSGLKNQLATTISTYAGGGRDVSGLTPQYMKVQSEIKRLESSLGVPPEGFELAGEIEGVKYFLSPDGQYRTIEESLKYQPSFNQSPSQGQDDIVNKIVAIESGGDYNAQNPTSSAFGKYQFLDSTRRQYAQKLGLTDAQSRSPQGQEMMFREFTKDNQRGLQQAGYPINAFTTYAAHQQGLGGAKAIFEGRITPEIERNMLANLPQKARLTGDTRNDWINYWSNKLA